MKAVHSPWSEQWTARDTQQCEALAALQEAIGYHCFRGMLTPNTEVYLSAASQAEDGSSPGEEFAPFL